MVEFHFLPLLMLKCYFKVDHFWQCKTGQRKWCEMELVGLSVTKTEKGCIQGDSNSRPQRGPELESGALTNSAMDAYSKNCLLATHVQQKNYQQIRWSVYQLHTFCYQQVESLVKLYQRHESLTYIMCMCHAVAPAEAQIKPTRAESCPSFAVLGCSRAILHKLTRRPHCRLQKNKLALPRANMSGQWRNG